jgi:hypothetical protein
MFEFTCSRKILLSPELFPYNGVRGSSGPRENQRTPNNSGPVWGGMKIWAAHSTHL